MGIAMIAVQFASFLSYLLNRMVTVCQAWVEVICPACSSNQNRQPWARLDGPVGSSADIKLATDKGEPARTWQ
jgi:hypothetical protein